MSTLTLNSCTSKPGNKDDDSDAKMDFLIDDLYLCKLDPLKWKEQDHYRLLGLSSLRQDATVGDIKKAYHKMVLLYHPDKRQQQQGDKASSYEADSNLFKCVQKAYEVLTDSQQRHAFDSVDPKFDESIPEPLSQKKLDTDPFLFYKTFIPVFEANARFSKIKPVPKLGNPSTKRENVEAFYSFWYNFDSTRSFEYLDEEDQNLADNRYDKRYMEKKNKTARLKRKTEDNVRLRKLVDNAAQSDPRLKLFKEQDKREREEQKKLKANALLVKARPTKQAAPSTENDRLKAKQADDFEKARLLEIKKQKEVERSQLKQLRKEIRTKIKEHSFFTATSEVGLLEKRITSIETKLETYLTIEELKIFSQTVTDQVGVCIKTGDVASFYKNFESAHQNIEGTTSSSSAIAESSKTQHIPSINGSIEWSTSEVQCLIKACNTIPGGTRLRWEKIASYVREHAAVPHMRTNEEIIEKSKEILKLGKSAIDKLDENELQNSLKKKVDPRIESIPSCSSNVDVKETVTWTKGEQSLLEDGLRKYPASNPNRWDLIAEGIQTKTKAQILERFKEIAKSIKAVKNVPT